MICNKVIIIDQGTIKAADTPSNLTANLRAAGKITLEFRGDLALITQKLENLEHVKKVIHEGTDADGWHTLTVRAEAGTDTREKAARLLAEQGCPLRHIYRHTPTLEEVFVEMTRKQPPFSIPAHPPPPISLFSPCLQYLPFSEKNSEAT